jgi:hypothetical protein
LTIPLLLAILLESLNNKENKAMANKENEKVGKFENIIGFVFLWIARFGLGFLAVAGMLHLLGGEIDPVILYPISVGMVAFLLKETL